MNEHPIKDAEDWAASLAALRALSAEVQAALIALSHNDLAQFEASVAAQEKLCDSLRGSSLLKSNTRVLIADLKAAAASAFVRMSGSGTPTERLAEIQKELAHLNRVYATFVDRAQKFFHILLRLNQGTRQNYSREGKTVTADHTWSCEV
jgi:hypothetical protein